MSEFKERKTITLGEVCQKSDFKTKEVEVNEEGICVNYYLKCWIPDDVDQAGIGEPSIVVKRNSYLNFRLVRDEEREKFPDWKKDIAQLACWFSLNQETKK